MSKAFNLQKAQRQLWLFGLFKIPLIGFCRPRILELNSETALVRIKLRRRTKNHLNSMYFGALSVGADIAGGFHVLAISEQMGLKVTFAFKSFSAEFIKRPEDDVFFICRDGLLVADIIKEAKAIKERINKEVAIEAFVNKDGKADIVAQFKLTLSVKVK